MDNGCILVIFGATGDLTHKKLMPALYNLEYNKMLPENFSIAAIGRRDKDSEIFQQEKQKGIEEYARMDMDEAVWQRLKKRVNYIKFDFTKSEGYNLLNQKLKKLDEANNTGGNRIFYLATAPRFFEVIVEYLDDHNMVDNKDSWQRVVIEKPFGRDLDSAIYLNNKITQVFEEKNIYRIDHYLGKEMIQNIMYLRFTNLIFDAIWNKDHIDNVQVTVSENIGIENRGKYYEKSGALKDMIQNHLSQILALVAMEPPVSFTMEAIRNEKVKVFKALRHMTEETVKNNAIFGQYEGNGQIKGYLEEEGVDQESTTETFAALKIFIDNERWEGVPFYIRSGKRLKDKAAYVIIQFKATPKLNFMHQKMLEPNLLIISIQPGEGIFLKFNMKEPASLGNISPAKMDFCQNCNLDYKSPEAYERLLGDVIKGDSTLFTRWDELENSWRFIQSVINHAKENKKDLIYKYPIGSTGPKEADWLLMQDNRKWWSIGGE